MNPSDFFSSKCAAKTLRGRNPAILRGGGCGQKMERPIPGAVLGIDIARIRFIYLTASS